MRVLTLLLFCFPACALAQVRYSSFLSGSGTDVITAITVDRTGYVYATGYTDSPDLPRTTAALTGNGQRGVDAFLAKFDPSSQQWVYCAYFGGSGDDRGQAIALDPNGDIVIAGATTSPDLPLTLPVQTVLRGNRDGFVAKISASSGRVLFSTYLGGGADDAVAALAVDAVGYIHAAGKTNSSDFPLISGLQKYQGRYDGFLSVLDSRAGRLVYSTFLGGAGDDEVTGIAVDASGNQYLTGNTSSPLIPLANAVQGGLSGPQDIFVLKMTAAGALSYATYFGGRGSESASGIAVDSNGTAHVTGTTNSADLPLRNALQSALHGTTDAFIAAFTPQGQLTYAGYIGGYGPDTSTAIAVDASRVVYVVGYTGSSDFPRVGPSMPYKGSYDAFLVEYAPDYTSMRLATPLGGYASDSALAVAIGPGMVWLGGQTLSIDFKPGSRNQYVLVGHGGFEGFLAGFVLNRPVHAGLAAAETWLTWYLDTDSSYTLDVSDQRTAMGLVSDIPVTGDWDGSGKTRIGVYRAGWWYLDMNGNGVWDGEPIDKAYYFGVPTDVPVVGDWDGSGISKIGVYRAGWWYLDVNGNGQWDGTPVDRAYYMGVPTDIPVVGDWDGSGISKIGVYRAGWWYLDVNGNGQWDGTPIDRAYYMGVPTDIPVVGDWDGSGISKIGVYRAGWWYLDMNGNGQWDWTGDKSFYFWKAAAAPVTGRW